MNNSFFHERRLLQFQEGQDQHPELGSSTSGRESIERSSDLRGLIEGYNNRMRQCWQRATPEERQTLTAMARNMEDMLARSDRRLRSSLDNHLAFWAWLQRCNTQQEREQWATEYVQGAVSQASDAALRIRFDSADGFPRSRDFLSWTVAEMENSADAAHAALAAIRLVQSVSSFSAEFRSTFDRQRTPWERAVKSYEANLKQLHERLNALPSQTETEIGTALNSAAANSDRMIRRHGSFTTDFPVEAGEALHWNSEANAITSILRVEQRLISAILAAPDGTYSAGLRREAEYRQGRIDPYLNGFGSIARRTQPPNVPQRVPERERQQIERLRFINQLLSEPATSTRSRAMILSDLERQIDVFNKTMADGPQLPFTFFNRALASDGSVFVRSNDRRLVIERLRVIEQTPEARQWAMSTGRTAANIEREDTHTRTFLRPHIRAALERLGTVTTRDRNTTYTFRPLDPPEHGFAFAFTIEQGAGDARQTQTWYVSQLYSNGGDTFILWKRNRGPGETMDWRTQVAFPNNDLFEVHYTDDEAGRHDNWNRRTVSSISLTQLIWQSRLWFGARRAEVQRKNEQADEARARVFDLPRDGSPIGYVSLVAADAQTDRALTPDLEMIRQMPSALSHIYNLGLT